ncbi:hypothetical protein BCR41DRAFT_418334 [Lobosporangium transversale]|uniref:3'-5' exonuclease n=1 Tax=Lobosporangium transversale TaxID=64571 RepID=A0A1Y2H110_9FUNG|nr:hypothetical protein BCR41DRAFT_418334 [Lobosporangium transversale]ORZ28238.1 hypothetical protein BCR41DRAFT_418334 [Lobosporangium transversale]|eukprot:XP_021885923.1 hypothetical protein BCR41DRAFT_418334 [Lobosporangium transversale]
MLSSCTTLPLRRLRTPFGAPCFLRFMDVFRPRSASFPQNFTVDIARQGQRNSSRDATSTHVKSRSYDYATMAGIPRVVSPQRHVTTLTTGRPKYSSPVKKSEKAVQSSLISSLISSTPLSLLSSISSSAPKTQRSISFPRPGNLVPPGPDALPYLDFRTNDSREVFYTNNEEEANLWLESPESSRTKMWAFDLEWKAYDYITRGTGRVALVQLGNDKTIYLFHVIHMNKFPSVLARILEDPRVLKVGINIQNDGTKLMKDWGVGCASLVELGVLSFQLQPDPSQRIVRSMTNLTRELLKHDVKKNSSTRMGDWDRKCLSSKQLAYAANDAFVTYKVAERIKELQMLQPPPKQDYIVRLITIGADGAIRSDVRGTLQERENHAMSILDLVDRPLKGSAVKKSSPLGDELPLSTTTGITPATKVTMAGHNSTIRARRKQNTKAKTSAAPKSLDNVIIRLQKSETASSSWDLPSESPRKRTIKKLSALKGDLKFFYTNNEETHQAIRHGSRSVVTVIPLKQRQRFLRQQKRTFTDERFTSRESSCRADNNNDYHGGGATSDSNGAIEIKGHRYDGDVYLPSQLLPEPLDGKDVLERNQAVWLESSGSDHFDSSALLDREDWYLGQNQALFQSLVSDSIAGEAIPSRRDPAGSE